MIIWYCRLASLFATVFMISNMVISLIAMPALQVASLLQSMRNKNKIFVTFASCIIQLYNFPEERKLTMLLFGFRLCILRSNDNTTLHTDTAKKLQNVLDICIEIVFCILLQDFPEKAWEPKVQLPYKAEQGQVPRKIEIERFVLFVAHQKLCFMPLYSY